LAAFNRFALFMSTRLTTTCPPFVFDDNLLFAFVNALFLPAGTGSQLKIASV
jgi:hypothetical protein